jgi:hypothetical protein
MFFGEAPSALVEAEALEAVPAVSKPFAGGKVVMTDRFTVYLCAVELPAPAKPDRGLRIELAVSVMPVASHRFLPRFKSQIWRQSDYIFLTTMAHRRE